MGAPFYLLILPKKAQKFCLNSRLYYVFSNVIMIITNIYS